jgi:hypothetical protein
MFRIFIWYITLKITQLNLFHIFLTVIWFYTNFTAFIHVLAISEIDFGISYSEKDHALIIRTVGQLEWPWRLRLAQTGWAGWPAAACLLGHASGP